MGTLGSVLLHLDNRPASATRLEFARALALRHEAALAAMFVAALPQASIQLAFLESPAAYLQKIERDGLARSKSLLQAACARAEPVVDWLDSGGADPVEAFCRHALYADLLVLGQHDHSGDVPRGAPPDFVESVLLATGKPALVLPHTGGYAALGRSVLIGWNSTPQAARAVTAALPWLRNARVVHVLESNDASAQRADGDLGIVQYLGLHGIEAVSHSHRTPPADAGSALLTWGAEIGADLLVMGCYGHSRAREYVLGGASRVVLAKTTLPVLMAH
jgi:nucleotide-binding universal stress UspA family protein